MLKALLPMTMALELLSSCAPKGDLPRFHEVDAGKLYRSAQPTKSGYDQLKMLRIRTVVKLNSDNAQDEEAWARDAGIHLIEIPLPGLLAPPSAEEDKVQDALSNSLHWPVLVHCEQGEDRTGLAVALYRIRAQQWTYEAARAEWYQFGHSVFLRGMDNFLEEYK